MPHPSINSPCQSRQNRSSTRFLWPIVRLFPLLCFLHVLGWRMADKLILQMLEPPQPLPHSGKSKTAQDGQENITKIRLHPFHPSGAGTAKPRRISLIVEFRGELGNQLSVLAWARRTQLLGLAATPPIYIDLVGQLKKNANEIRGRDDLVHCFPEFRSFNFDGGIYDADFLPIQKLQKKWLSEKEQAKLVNARELSFLEKLLEYQAAGAGPPIPNATVYSLPYLTVRGFTFPDVLESDDFYHDLRHWFRFDEAACCNQVPDSDEAVFHYRNFLAEIGQRALGSRYTEVTPETASRGVFHNYFNNTGRRRVAMISRTIQGLEPYVEVLKQEQGISARIIAAQSGVQDFCFIIKARAELICPKQSTFARWASLLSNVSLVRYYQLDQRQESPVFNSTAQKRIADVKNVANRLFIVEEYWQPDQHSNINVTSNA